MDRGSQRADAVAMRINVGRPSVQDGESLCDTYRLAHVLRGRRVDEVLTFCQSPVMHQVRITFRVSTCSEYVDDREPSYAKLMEKAWILTPSSKRRPAGFVRACDLKADEPRRYFCDPRERD